MTNSPVTYGFAATLTAKPGRGDDLVKLLLSGLEEGNPASSEYCLVYLVSRSASDPDVAHVIEGWTTEDDHHRIFATPAAQAIVAGFAELLEGESVYTDLIPVGGKAAL
ncbi:putative quinol monooxygenase [Herbiconiux ginsengi]|uniref:Quinol monooxygenase YgiN n=1 Tax=Herbiconiux ginsengi TaxID=381665 RepID=A0A1H3LJY8_9MICO|nr:antibiotic biosynthesis monooxygenase [Herbiconiux ginsengi]SDY64656.1 Quinol monooxygenase YgiN [Herbiconiux ginsengi]